MNLFRSEDHARNWDQFDPEMERTLLPLERWFEIFSGPFFRERGRHDYISWMRSKEGAAAFALLRSQLP